MACLKLLPLTDEVEKMYSSHSHFHDGDSGLDLYIKEDQLIKAGESDIIPLGIKATLYNAEGKNVSWLLMARSSISKTPLRLSNAVGLIDAGYRGEVKLAVDNIKDYDYKVKKGERIAQAVAFSGESMIIEVVSDLDKTERGEGGFGSTQIITQ